ncbi:MAG TPA: lysylphosphatidylglycerol synthase transmembrane domain-containing protein, partial [Candidatus Krumholzibacteria bacterium]|nr:lysylphosphatidylglycerol synthase transmembrane domain-containing protein [Candidatus Krumholzibacteria bacterium]
FGQALARTRWIYLVPAVFFTMLGHFSRSLRWKYMMDPIKRCGIRPLWSATAIAFMVNNLLPARLGELVRAFVIGRSQHVSRSASFATIVYERVVDVFVLILLLWFCMVHISGPEWLSRSAVILVAFNIALFFLLFAMVRWRERFRVLIARVVRPFPHETQRRMHDAADAFVTGLGVVTKPKASLPIALLSVVVWGCAILGVWFCLIAFRLSLPPMASLMILVLVSLGSMIPSAPAFLGTLQYACVVALGLYGIDRAHALAFSAVYHATQFLPITATGLYYAWGAHLHWRELTEGRLT